MLRRVVCCAVRIAFGKEVKLARAGVEIPFTSLVKKARKILKEKRGFRLRVASRVGGLRDDASVLRNVTYDWGWERTDDGELPGGIDMVGPNGRSLVCVWVFVFKHFRGG